MFYNASNNAWSRLSSAISASATSLTVQGGNWPEPPFLISIEDEIIEVNNKSGNTFSNLVRGMEGTTPAPHPANARVENRFTAGTYSLLKDVLTDSRIVEHNLTVSDPSNGWYIRWNNGLQICFVRCVAFTGDGTSDVKSGIWTHPAAFASPPVVVGRNAHEAADPQWYLEVNPGSGSLMTGVLWRAYRTGGSWVSAINYELHYIAIGRWK